nr:uncharacterized protein LOC133616860 [Nerophis lumbriciformis]
MSDPQTWTRAYKVYAQAKLGHFWSLLEHEPSSIAWIFACNCSCDVRLINSYHLGATFRMPFHLIKFIMNGDIAVVPSGWYVDGMVFWPNYKNTDRIKRAALNEEQHESNWPRFDVSVVRTCDNYKDALKIMQQYGKGCDTSDLQSEAENEEFPEKRSRKPVHRFGDSDDSDSDLASLGSTVSPSASKSREYLSTGDNFQGKD